jgi:hypothetical protein
MTRMLQPFLSFGLLLIQTADSNSLNNEYSDTSSIIYVHRNENTLEESTGSIDLTNATVTIGSSSTCDASSIATSQSLGNNHTRHDHDLEYITSVNVDEEEVECNVWLAPSTIPGAGLGMFAGKDFGLWEPIGLPDLVIPVTDYYAHNPKQDGFIFDVYGWYVTRYVQ